MLNNFKIYALHKISLVQKGFYYLFVCLKRVTVNYICIVLLQLYMFSLHFTLILIDFIIN